MNSQENYIRVGAQGERLGIRLGVLERVEGSNFFATLSNGMAGAVKSKDGQIDWLSVKDLYNLAHPSREKVDSLERTNTLEDASLNLFDKMRHLAGERAYLDVITDPYVLKHRSTLSDEVLKNELDLVAQRAGGLSVKQGKRYSQIDADATRLGDAMNVVGLPSNKSYTFGSGENRVTVRTRDLEDDLRGVSAFAGWKLPRALAYGATGVGTVCVLVSCAPQPAAEVAQIPADQVATPAESPILPIATAQIDEIPTQEGEEVVADAELVVKGVKEFNKWRVEYEESEGLHYDKNGNLIASSGKDTGVKMIGAFTAKLSGSDESSDFLMGQRDGGVEAFAMKTKDGSWRTLTAVEYPGYPYRDYGEWQDTNGATEDAFNGEFFPKFGSELDASGAVVGLFYFDKDGIAHKITKSEGGKTAMLSISVDAYSQAIEMMEKSEYAETWNFAESEFGLSIMNKPGEISKFWDDVKKEWVNFDIPGGSVVTVTPEGIQINGDPTTNSETGVQVGRFSPAVEAIMADEKTPVAVSAFLTDVKEGGFAAEVTTDNKINILGVIEIDQTTGKVTQSFEYMGMTVKAEGMVGIEYVIGQNSRGETVIIDASREWNAKGEWERRQMQFPGIDGKVETGPMLELYSNEEVNIEQVVTTKDATPEEIEFSDKGGYAILDKLFGRKLFNGRAYYTYAGMFVGTTSKYVFGDNMLQITDPKGNMNTYETSFYAVQEFGADRKYALVGWIAGGEEYVRIVNKPELKDPKNFNSYFASNAPKW